MATEPLLKKVYYDDCPGCRIDKKKEENTGIPYIQFAFIWIVTVCAALPISSLFPFLYFLIRDLHVAKRVEDIGFYAGFVGSSLTFGRAMSSMLWGIVADKYGRKPVLVIGILSVIIFNTIFGLTMTYWMAIVTRLFLGFFNGILITVKAYAAESCRPEHQALALSNVSTAWAIGLIIGPAIGGFFALPAEKYPHIISKDSFLGRFPYFLPCFVISLVATVAAISCFWLPETLHKCKHVHGTIEAPEASSNTKENCQESEEKEHEESLLKNWPLMSSILLYCVISLQDMAYTELFSLWTVSDRKFGGLSFTTQKVGEVLAISGFFLLLSQLLVYPTIERALGALNAARVAGVLTIPLLAVYPYMNKLYGAPLLIALNCASFFKTFFNMTIVTATFILQNNAVAQHRRGAANGIAMTLQSLFRAVAPASAGIIFSWAQRRQHASFLPGDQIVFFFLNVLGVIALIMCFKPFLAFPPK